jgi:hypothetical protein
MLKTVTISEIILHLLSVDSSAAVPMDGSTTFLQFILGRPCVLLFANFHCNIVFGNLPVRFLCTCPYHFNCLPSNS